MNETVKIKVEIPDSGTENTIQDIPSIDLDLSIVKRLKKEEDLDFKNITKRENQDYIFEPEPSNIWGEIIEGESEKYQPDNNDTNFVEIKHKFEFDSPEENSNIRPMDVVATKVEESDEETNKETKREQVTRIKKWLNCAQCSYKFQYQCDLKRHVTSRHCDERLVKCSKCDFTTKRVNALEQHLVNKHTPENFEWIHCEHCSYKGKRQCDYRRHLTTVHSEIKDFKCGSCDAAFNRRGNLNRHILAVHTSESLFKWHECGQCPKRYKEKRDLNKHMAKIHQCV